MKHDEIRELLALRLYDELEPDEQRSLEAHLRGCTDCARFANELEVGLGRVRIPEESPELPPDWDARLARSTATLRRRSWTREALLVASGLAAGVLLMIAWGSLARGPHDMRQLAHLDPDAPAFLRFQGDTPPPPATGGGPSARYLAWRARMFDEKPWRARMFGDQRRTSKRSCAAGCTSRCSKAETRAPGGPMRSQSTISSTIVSGPSTQTSTRPSGRFCTQPARPSSRARSLV